jgi:hypothetical protein
MESRFRSEGPSRQAIRRDEAERLRKNLVQTFQRMALGISGWVCVYLLVATVHGQNQLLPELPQTNSPVTLAAASDPVTGKSEFRYQGNNIPPVIRVQPGSILNIEYKNELVAESKEECVGHPCMQMTPGRQPIRMLPCAHVASIPVRMAIPILQ